jgi:hypothetical protein
LRVWGLKIENFEQRREERNVGQIDEEVVVLAVEENLCLWMMKVILI